MQDWKETTGMKSRLLMKKTDHCLVMPTHNT